ncbi:tryptophan synthase subunit alpha [Arcanobacterium ihumii]|uniref:tryptophan synthase subunit alpha n=1 Tax=Arcanobacterium ihumii TaxID=2138162 RepID=UPI001F1D1710|nr:tryptophan synthase subunit alpha [Arcanobacterium ihumii]
MAIRTGETIDAALANGRPAFIGYLPVGFPTVDRSIEAAKQIVASGVDVVELGFPYTDPTMDGSVIQHAAQQALDNGVKRGDIFRAVEKVSDSGAAVVVMTYYNLVFKYGVDNFARDLAQAGGAGLIIPDLIPEEATDWMEVSDSYNLDRIFLVAPLSTDERIRLTAEASRGFVYAASRMGVTGVQSSVGSDAENLVERARKQGARRVAVGIGVSTPDQAKEVGRFADGVIVGSALVKALEGDDYIESLDRLSKVTSDIFSGVEQARHVA